MLSMNISRTYWLHVKLSDPKQYQPNNSTCCLHRRTHRHFASTSTATIITGSTGDHASNALPPLITSSTPTSSIIPTTAPATKARTTTITTSPYTTTDENTPDVSSNTTLTTSTPKNRKVDSNPILSSLRS
uniref:Uncharacterized protein n=1 Tax=Schistocephalus solidus TaxID=70667 RepID=A0A0X3NRS9_SCHSO